MREDLERVIDVVKALTGSADCTPGPVSREGLERLQEKYVNVPDDVIDFYRVTNGAQLSDPWWEFEPVHRVLANAATLDAMIATDFAGSQEWWSLAWIPVGSDVSGNALCVDTAASGGVRGQVMIFMHDEAARRIVAPSLGAYIKCLAIATETGLIRYTPEDGFWLEGNQMRWDAFLSSQLQGYPRQV